MRKIIFIILCLIISSNLSYAQTKYKLGEGSFIDFTDINKTGRINNENLPDPLDIDDAILGELEVTGDAIFDGSTYVKELVAPFGRDIIELNIGGLVGGATSEGWWFKEIRVGEGSTFISSNSITTDSGHFGDGAIDITNKIQGPNFVLKQVGPDAQLEGSAGFNILAGNLVLESAGTSIDILSSASVALRSVGDLEVINTAGGGIQLGTNSIRIEPLKEQIIFRHEQPNEVIFDVSKAEDLTDGGITNLHQHSYIPAATEINVDNLTVNDSAQFYSDLDIAGDINISTGTVDGVDISEFATEVNNHLERLDSATDELYELIGEASAAFSGSTFTQSFYLAGILNDATGGPYSDGYYIKDFQFDDDVIVTGAYISSTRVPTGSTIVATDFNASSTRTIAITAITGPFKKDNWVDVSVSSSDIINVKVTASNESAQDANLVLYYKYDN